MRVNNISQAAITIHSTTLKSLVNVQYNIDVSSFQDPLGQFGLKARDGLDKEVQKFVREDPKVFSLIDHINLIVKDEVGIQGSKYLSFAFKDHQGKLLAPAIAEIVGAELEKSHAVFVQHHFLPKVVQM